MTTVVHAWPYGRFIETQRNLRRKKRHRMNQGSNFFGGSFSNRGNVRAPIQLRRESQPSTFKDDFPLRIDPSIFTLIVPVLLDQSNETSWVFPALKSKSTVIRFKFRNQFELLPQIICLITLRVDSSIIIIDSNIADNIIRKVINV